MKILYLTKGDHIDYQNDCLLIGLKELYGSDVVDFNKQHHIYDTYNQDATNLLYGKGMTVTRVLPDLDVDRTDITSKIRNKYFDLIVYGSIWRCNDHIQKILESYNKNKIIVIDGEDETNIHETYNLGIIYFKRELIYKKDRLFPISFAIPTNKLDFTTSKTKDFSFITPLNKDTYIYIKEEDYYNDYKEARLGVTLKKAGWDCMRHYEILANGCLPYFVDISKCPEQTMTTFPKHLCIELKELLKTRSSEQVYSELSPKFQQHVQHNNTTQALAKYFLTKINNQ